MISTRQRFDTYLAPTSPHPVGLEVERAEGCFIWDKQGRRYIDLVSGIAVNNIGHRHPHVMKAIQAQSERYLHVMPYGEFIQEPSLALAEKLASLLPDGLDCSYFVNSGAEAIEAAMKLAKRATGRTHLVAARKAYHGSTHGTLSITDNEEKKYHARPLLPDVSFIGFGELADLDMITQRTAAVIIEPVQGDAGVRIAPEGYLRQLRLRCDEVGALLIFDEIQTGIGRTGSIYHLEQVGVVPDILCSAKALGAGLPIGAFVSSHELMQLWTHHPKLGHITTFGGHPLSCASALAGLEVIESEGLLSQVEAKGQRFEDGLRHPAIKEIRRAGLMLAIDFDDPELVQAVVEGCMAAGIITFWFLSCPGSFRLQPPLNIPDGLIDEACQTIQGIFTQVTAHSN